MSDANPFAPPRAEVLDAEADLPSDADITSLDVSEGWKRKFLLIHKAGGPKLPRMLKLKLLERLGIGFNVLALVLGPFYYACKGMWRKGLVIFSLCLAAYFVLDIVLSLFRFSYIGDRVIFIAPAVFAVRANVDYYRRMVLGENGWW